MAVMSEVDAENPVASVGAARFRQERDLLGAGDVPAEAYWGIHTSRAVQNFPITGIKVGHYPEFVRALALVKWSVARTNHKLGHLRTEKVQAIEEACRRLCETDVFHDQFVVDVIQGGAGTSTNMNANEVIANLALEFLGHRKGEYHHLHPNDDVNMAQSTNDVYPTALRLALILAAKPLLSTLDNLAYAFKRKAMDFVDVIKVGRTQLQDAVPMTAGQELDAYGVTIREDIARLREAMDLMREVNLGATAIGTGITTDQRYAHLAVEELSHLSHQRLVLAGNLIEATSDTGAFVLFSGILKRIAIKLSKICNDLRLLSSGPRAGLAEIRLPAVQAGSSIMPGKVNPVIPEVVNQVAFTVIGHDLTVTLCAEGGQLQLNAFEPTIAHCLLAFIKHLTAAVTVLDERCVTGIEIDRERCLAMVQDSIGLATALTPILGYEMSSHVAKRALAEGRRIADVVLEEQLLSSTELDAALRLENMIAPAKVKMTRP